MGVQLVKLLDAVTITGPIGPQGPQGDPGGGHTIQEEGSSLTARTKLNFVGAGVTVTDGGAGTDDTIVTIPDSSANALPLSGGTMTGGIVNSTSVNPLTTLAESWIGPASTTGIYFKSGFVGIGTNNPQAHLNVVGALRLSGDGTDLFTTPVGSAVATKINIPLFDPGSFGQILIAGLPSNTAASSRAMVFVDARTVAHQPTFGIFNPSEEDIFGLSWDGSNTIAYLKTLGANIVIRSNTTDIATFLSNGTVGIGTTSPDTSLTLKQSGSVEEPTLGTGSGTLSMLNSTGVYGLYVGINEGTGYTWMQGMRNDGAATTYGLELNPKGGHVNINFAGYGSTLPAQFNVVGSQGWCYQTTDPVTYYLKLDQVVTSGVVRWSFSQLNDSTSYPNTLVFNRSNVGIGVTDFGTSAAKTLGLGTGVAPTTSPADMFQMYSADIAAGNAAPHFRSEAGDIVKLFKGAALTTALTTITFTAPGTPDYAVQDFTQTVPWGFASQDEANTVLSVIANSQARINDLETRLIAAGLLT